MTVKASLLRALLVIGSLANSLADPLPRPAPIYSNQFAVHVPDGPEAAAEVAAKYAFDNYGQVSARDTDSDSHARYGFIWDNTGFRYPSFSAFFIAVFKSRKEIIVDLVADSPTSV